MTDRYSGTPCAPTTGLRGRQQARKGIVNENGNGRRSPSKWGAKPRMRLVMALLAVLTCLPALAQQKHFAINYYSGNKIDASQSLPWQGGTVTDARSNEWRIEVDSTVVDKRQGIVDYVVRYTLLSPAARQVSLGVNFDFDGWSAQNFVFVPAIVYDGNRFDRKVINYPPYWYDPEEWRIDMPTTTPLIPSLEKYESRGRIELTTGNAATPLMAFYSPGKSLSWMVQCLQGNRLGDFGLFIDEDKQQRQARFAIMSPAVREKRATGSGFADSDDRAADLKAGDTVELSFRVYSRRARSLQEMYGNFLRHRKELNPHTEDYAVMPFSEVWRVMDALFQKDRWSESIDMYCLTKPGTYAGWNQIWQLGWVGGGQATLPMLLQGDATAIDRAMRNLGVIFGKTQAPSGFYYAYGNGREFKSFGYGEAFKHNETFVRSQGDFLYMAQRQFARLKELHRDIPSAWFTSLRREADAFCNLWERYGQVGQFVDVETCDICIGGSTAGAIVPGGLALASQTFGDSRYLRAAEGLAAKFYDDYVLKGYTTGGPGEILSSPDSESAFALFESFVTLYEVTGQGKWLDCAKDLLPICASWVVSYDFRFPEHSAMHRIDAHSTGSVWASVANKHSAPAICTWSGESLLKYYRATADPYALSLLKDIAHGVPQYISHSDRPIGNMEPGGACERVNLSDWEGKQNVGGNLFASCAWVEVATMLTVTQLPSIYLQRDKGIVEVFDHLKAELLSRDGRGVELRVSNPTRYDAEVKIYVETSKDARRSLYTLNDPDKVKVIKVKANSSETVRL